MPATCCVHKEISPIFLYMKPERKFCFQDRESPTLYFQPHCSKAPVLRIRGNQNLGKEVTYFQKMKVKIPLFLRRAKNQ